MLLIFDCFTVGYLLACGYLFGLLCCILSCVFVGLLGRRFGGMVVDFVALSLVLFAM